jgi:hypothetical protein
MKSGSIIFSFHSLFFKWVQLVYVYFDLLVYNSLDKLQYIYNLFRSIMKLQKLSKSLKIWRKLSMYQDFLNYYLEEIVKLNFLKIRVRIWKNNHETKFIGINIVCVLKNKHFRFLYIHSFSIFFIFNLTISFLFDHEKYSNFIESKFKQHISLFSKSNLINKNISNKKTN